LEDGKRVDHAPCVEEENEAGGNLEPCHESAIRRRRRSARCSWRHCQFLVDLVGAIIVVGVHWWPLITRHVLPGKVSDSWLRSHFRYCSTKRRKRTYLPPFLGKIRT
jgi:hypothetical protein